MRHVDCFCDLSQALPFADCSFDTVIATDVVEHIPDVSKAWQELVRVLRVNGKLIVGTPFLYWIHEQPHDYGRYTEFKLRVLCTENACKVLELEEYGGSIDVIVDIVLKHIGRSILARALNQILSLVWVDSGLRNAINKRTAKQFPLGYCLVATKH
jgi:SAM-dependent methyltransferase